MRKEDCYDVIIIGGGPAGLYSAFYSGLRGLKTKLIECQPRLGGKLHLYPEKMIWDVGGQVPITGAKLIEQLVEQGLTFRPTVVLNEQIVSITRTKENKFVLSSASGEKHYAKTVIVTVGSGVIKPQKLHIDGAERFEITNLHYTVQSLKAFKGKRVIISGGGNSAVDWANELEMIAEKVYLSYRKSSLKGHEAQISQLMNSSVECFPETTISQLKTRNHRDRIERVELKHQGTGEVFALSVDDVLINHGFDCDASLLANSDIDVSLVNDFTIAGNAQSESSVPGLYAAGDILTYDGKVNLIAGAFQDAVNAVNKAKQFIEPGAEKVAVVSSHNHTFKQRNRALVKQLVD